MTTTKECKCNIIKLPDTKTRLIKEYCAKFILSNNDLEHFKGAFLFEIKNGLGRATHDDADIKCHITYVTDLPNGTEKGKFLGLDVGGSNFRVLLVELKGNRTYDVLSKLYNIPTEIMTETGAKFFDFIADCLSDFVTTHNLNDYSDTMGFTFSFSVNQVGLDNGVLMRWSKGFNCSGVVGKNVVELLLQAIQKKNDIKIRRIALLNDTTGILMSCALENINCKIGIAIDTGTNGCYLEKVTEVENWDSTKSDATHVIINCEFGAFGENGCLEFLRTDEDRYLDLNSLNVGQAYLEKMVAGMYLGELVRLIMIKFVKDKLLFDGHGSDVLDEPDSIKTKHLAEIEIDSTGSGPNDYINLKRILKEMRLYKYATDCDLDNIYYICKCITKRSAQLISAAIATLINKMGDKKCTVGIDGSVYRLLPCYKNIMEETIKELIHPGLTFELMLSDDGPGKGVAIIAAVLDRTKNS